MFTNVFRLSFCRKQPKTFAFDHCFFSTDPSAPHFASQDIVFDSVGRDILENAFQGYNACIFAYGQTGKYLTHVLTFQSDSLAGLSITIRFYPI
jgi:kinesin family member 13